MLSVFFTVISNMCTTEAQGSYSRTFQPRPWTSAHATFYGDETTSTTMCNLFFIDISWSLSTQYIGVPYLAINIMIVRAGGACGCENLFNTHNGTQAATLSIVLYNGGYGCRQCSQLWCVQSKCCFPGSPITTVTATKLFASQLV